MIWRNPLAWLGLGTLLVPIAIHLLVRQHAQPLAFPSLRFLQTSRLAAVRRRAVSDWLLLAVRLLVLALAVAALADPFFISDSRRASWSARTARAIVVDTSASVDRAASAATALREQASAFQAMTIDGSDLGQGVARAQDWLRTAPPAAREIVIVSDFQRGSVTPFTLRALPEHVGVRLVRVGQPSDRRVIDGRPATVRTNAHVGTQTPTATVLPDRTDVQWRVNETAGAIEAEALGLRLRTTPDDRAAAQAALDAVLSEGIPVAHQSARPIIVAIGDAARTLDRDTPLQPLAAPWMAETMRAVMEDPALDRAVSAGDTAIPAITAASTPDGAGPPALVLRSTLPAASDATPLLIRAALRATADPDPLPEAEVATIADAALAAWQRPPALPPVDELSRVDSADRRWFWAAALLLLGLETWMRRRARERTPDTREVAHAA